ncbi:c-type cytochrome [Candidatus Halobeggiatoa sp. HSG11]|nr:c-type cytochrome [Candidatus Halobeggiatoa sp. HSG11]
MNLNIIGLILILSISNTMALDGQNLYQKYNCPSCHGVDGNKTITFDYPKIAGQNKNYLIKQLKSLKSGQRNNSHSPTMTVMMQKVTELEIEAIATWLATLAIKADPNIPINPKGKFLYQNKTCFACHGKNAKKPFHPDYPILAGQHKKYTITQMQDIKDGSRNNDYALAMKGIMYSVTQQDMKDIAEWLATLGEKVSAETTDIEPIDIYANIITPWNKKNYELRKALKIKPDLANGKILYEVCATCHSEHGWGKKDGTFPQIAGQHYTVLLKQLADIRAKNRDNPTMYPFSVSEEFGSVKALADVSGYISKLLMNPENGLGTGDDLKYGKKLYLKQCASCHGEKGQGDKKNYYPRLQGQHYEYMLRQIRWIKAGKRRNANIRMMRNIEKFSERDLKAVIDYISRLKPYKGRMGVKTVK